VDRKDPNTLLAYQRAEHERAEKLGRIASWVDYPIMIVAVADVLFSSHSISIAIVGLLLGIGRYLSIFSSGQSQAVAERARRSVVLQNGLGIELSGKAFTDLYSAFSASEESASKHFDPDYYDSQQERGPTRLAELLEESVFWSKNLCKTASFWAGVKFFLALLILIVSLLLVASEGGETARVLAPQVFCIVIATLVTGGLFARAVVFGLTATQLDDIEGRVPSGSDSLEAILPVFEDYNAVIQAAPVIPSKFYRMKRDTLNELWRDRKGR